MTRRKRWILTLAGVLIVAGFLVASWWYAHKDDWYGCSPRVACLKNVMFIRMAMLQYSAEHDGDYPASFGVLLKEGYLPHALYFICPLRRREVPRGFPTDFASADLAVLNTLGEWGAYELVPGLRAGADGDYIVVYGKSPRHRNDDNVLWRVLLGTPDSRRGRPCMFCDGHVQWLPEEEFQEHMKAQKAKLREMGEKREDER